MNKYDQAHRIQKIIREKETHPCLKKMFIPEARMESMCDGVLEQHALMPESPSTVRIERLLEKHWGIVEEYVPLGSNILGAARFSAKGLEQIQVSQEFDMPEDSATERRGRSTLAHEIGHGILHEDAWKQYYFEKQQPDLFEETTSTASEPYSQMCRDDTILTGSMNVRFFEWWEFQANLAMGFLLMPTRLLNQVLEAWEPKLKKSNNIMTSMHEQKLIHELSETFSVNPALVRWRTKKALKSRKEQTLL